MSTTRLRRVVRALFDYLPKGQSLPEDVWRVRHRTLLYLLRAHVVGIFGYALVRGNTLPHSLFEAGIVGFFAVAATTDGSRRKLGSAMAALGLVTSSAVLVHLSGGLIEMHFHFFVMVGILTLYQDWIPFLAAIGFVVAHHGVMGSLHPDEVYNHPDAIAHPFKWAVVHGVFVLGASIASVVAWRLNEEQALKDALTRLPNRRLFQDRVGHALARSQRRPSSIGVLFIDLDGFKNVNDSLGHAAGDQLLTLVAERLRASVRTGDTPARLGGDEFAILLEDLRSVDDAMRIAERFMASLEGAFPLRGKETRVGASIGIALGAIGDTVEELLRNADVAMYTAKTAGRGRIEVFETHMHTAVVDRIDLERELLSAVADGELVLHYQPIVDLSSGRVSGVEALIRWQHPTRGLLAPAQFLDVAEETGAIVPIGAWVLDEACRQAAEWRDQVGADDLVMAVNLSATQLFRADIVDTVQSAIDRHALSPGSLVFELTEGVMLTDTPDTVDRLRALKHLGVLLAVDDFGTGYSSLSYLRRLPIDTLKIDKLFIDGLMEGPAEAEFAASIIKLAHTLDMQTVAEGVEHVEQIAKLQELGCDLAQGYHFAKPLHPDGIAALLRATSYLSVVPA